MAAQRHDRLDDDSDVQGDIGDEDYELSEDEDDYVRPVRRKRRRSSMETEQAAARA